MRGPVAIIEHADVRRMLLNIRAFVEGARALSGWTALQLDRAHAHAEPAERAKSDALVALLTPVVKAAFTDRKSVVSGKSVSGRVDLGGRRSIQKKISVTAAMY